MSQPASPFTDTDRLIQILRSDQILNENQQAIIKKTLSSDKLAGQSPQTLDDVSAALDKSSERFGSFELRGNQLIQAA